MDFSLVAVYMLLTEVASLVEEHGLSGARASVVVAHGSSQTRDQTRVSGISRQILYH